MRLISEDRLMKKPALIKEKAKKNILQPSARKSSRTKAATAPVTVSAVVNDPVPVEDKRRKLRLGSVARRLPLVFSVLYLLMLISYNQADPSFTHAVPMSRLKIGSVYWGLGIRHCFVCVRVVGLLALSGSLMSACAA